MGPPGDQGREQQSRAESWPTRPSAIVFGACGVPTPPDSVISSNCNAGRVLPAPSRIPPLPTPRPPSPHQPRSSSGRHKAVGGGGGRVGEAPFPEGRFEA